MPFEMKDLLEVIGPGATLIFASWIFMGFLEQRYVAAFEMYRRLIDAYRDSDDEARLRSVADQIPLYRRRCEQIRQATTWGVVSALFLITTVICGGVTVVWPQAGWLRFVGATAAAVGLLSVMVAAVLVIVENRSIRQVLDQELDQVPDIAARLRGERGRSGAGRPSA